MKRYTEDGTGVDRGFDSIHNAPEEKERGIHFNPKEYSISKRQTAIEKITMAAELTESTPAKVVRVIKEVKL